MLTMDSKRSSEEYEWKIFPILKVIGSFWETITKQPQIFRKYINSQRNIFKFQGKMSIVKKIISRFGGRRISISLRFLANKSVIVLFINILSLKSCNNFRIVNIYIYFHFYCRGVGI